LRFDTGNEAELTFDSLIGPTLLWTEAMLVQFPEVADASRELRLRRSMTYRRGAAVDLRVMLDAAMSVDP
jgi:hypothetical protein